MKEIIEFLEQRPSLNIEGLCREFDFTSSHWNYLKKGKRNLTEKSKAKIYPVLNKYGGSFRL
jgi:hypothetical protein